MAAFGKARRGSIYMRRRDKYATSKVSRGGKDKKEKKV